ncbi:L-aspartate oxidase [Acidimicrobium ferrooxidans DSM 10331]|uniref:L-aspartate oxidase n=1 Tax=Acidimicrobium ferrooxidans (strain DSM 10331 / JCM 15462 / NBRC 103882 / ICP) TaxID=525909 RepID=C7LYU0_ACIFD|nr:L-aspartate oxidase [Acidimicrobium ferrooxidans DSM 10331]
MSSFDVVIIGDGLAAASVALSVAPTLRVAIVAPRGAATSSDWAKGGIAAPVDGPDIGDHLADTIDAGAHLVDERAAKSILADGPSAIRWLGDQGVAFAPDYGLEAGHRRARIRHAAGDATGAAVMAALRPRLGSITRLDGTLVELITLDGRVVGAWVRTADGRLDAIAARRVVLATGGAGALFDAFTCPPTNLGTGIAAAAWAGARVVDLEFVQFHPTAIGGPRAPFALATEALRGAGALLVDADGTSLVDDLPARELTTRDQLALHLSVHATPAFLDARPIGPSLVDRFPSFVAAARTLGLDPLRELVPVRPAAHYTMGGIATDELGATSLPGLFAVGECAVTGLHGANRLASNSLLEAVVMGRRVGEAITEGDLPRPTPLPTALPRPVRRPALPLARLRALAALALGPLRDGDTLAAAYRTIKTAGLTGESSGDPSEAGATWLVGAMLAGAAARRGSVGAHARRDAIDEDPHYQLAVDADHRVTRELRP